MKDNIKILKRNIKQQLKQEGRTVADFCKAMNVNRNYINQLNAGTPIEKIINISYAIGCPLSDLMAGI